MLAECLPQSALTQTIDPMLRLATTDEQTSPKQTHDEEEEEEEEEKDSITSIKIPLMSSQPILATSDTHILLNEHTKRKKQFVLFDHHLHRVNVRSFITEELLDALWYEKEGCFLVLTPTGVHTLNPHTTDVDSIKEIFPVNAQLFKSFALINSSALLIAYNEWQGQSVDRWQQDENKHWQLIATQSLTLTANEYVGSMTAIEEGNSAYLGMTVYNDMTEQWRLEVRYQETLVPAQKPLLLSRSTVAHDYRVIPIENGQSNIEWLAFSAANGQIIAIDSEHRKQCLNYRNPVQRMAIFDHNYLLVRTRERIDIHSFI